MAERNGPTDGGRFKRAKPSGNHKGKKRPTETHTVHGTPRKATGPLAERPRSEKNGPALDRVNGEHMCTPDLIKQIAGLVEAGNYRDTAAASVGISRSTLLNWLNRGAHGEEPFATLLAEVEKADGRSEARDVLTIGKAAERHWQAAAWRLERKNPKKWGRKDGLEITGDEQKPVAVTVIKWGKDEVEFS